MTVATLPPDPIRAMYNALAMQAWPAGSDPELRSAFATVRDAIDMGVLPPEVLTEVIIGQRTIATAMGDCADVQADALADDTDLDAETKADVESFIASCRAAAKALS